jgi:hypothetical protein
MLPFALIEAELGSAVQGKIRLVGCCYLSIELGPEALPRAERAVTRTRRKRFDLWRSKTRRAKVQKDGAATI